MEIGKIRILSIPFEKRSCLNDVTKEGNVYIFISVSIIYREGSKNIRRVDEGWE